MNQELASRLRRLGVVKGARALKTPEKLRGATNNAEPIPQVQGGDGDTEPQPLAALLPGLELVHTAEGSCYVSDQVYPVEHRHGVGRLADLLGLSPAAAGRMCDDERLAEMAFRDFLFLDTETTGLGGAGTLAFMVGVAFYEDDAFVVRQYFLRDHGDEPALLLLLDELLATRPGLITFNGRGFDLPLLDGRFLLNRMPSDLLERPHLDLLPPARRLWRNRLSSCALGSLERSLLGVQRTHEDVPGSLIPSLYYQYLRDGDGRAMARVFYHNRLDLLSMVTLAAEVVRLFRAPEPGDHPLDLLGLGRWHIALGMPAEAERCLRMAAVPDMPLPYYQLALQQLALLLKRSDRRREAVTVWQQLASVSYDDVTAHVELAKHFEWHETDLSQARTWTERGLALLDGTGSAPVKEALEHRLARLARKQQQGSKAG